MSQFPPVFRRIRKLVGADSMDQLSDAELLKGFVQDRDEAAFEALLQRHGPMVLATCRRMLHNQADVEDAFQAAFLVLARNPGAVNHRELFSHWLYVVTCRVALKARAKAGLRRVREQEAASMAPIVEESSDVLPDLRPVLDEEVRRLPAKYRLPVILCHLQGKTNEEAARELGCPLGTVKIRLSRARDLLRTRLTRRGMALSAAAMGTVLTTEQASAAVPASLLNSTFKAASLFAAGQAAAGVIPASAIALAEGVLHTMKIAKLKLWAGLLTVLFLMGGGAGLLAYQTLGQARQPAEETVRLPDDPSAVVLTWNEPRLSVRADGFVAARDDLGAATARLPHAELDGLMRFLVREQNFFNLVTSALPNGRGSLDRQGAEITMRLRLCADGQDHQVEWNAGQMQAIQKRLEWLESWTYAGGAAGVNAALRSINGQLQKQFPEAPELTAADLQTVWRQGGNVRQIAFERRGVAADGNPFSFVFGVLDQVPGKEPKVTVKANLLAAAKPGEEELPKGPVDCVPKPISSDSTVKYDFDIVYVRLPRQTKYPYFWAEINPIHRMPAGGDLMILHPDGSEEVLVAAGENASIQDPMPSFDAQWVYYAHFRALDKAGTFFPSPEGADIYKVHVKSRKIVRLTHQTFTPNTGAADWSSDFRTREKGKNYLHYGVLNCGPCPLPGGKVVFSSNRNAHVPPRGGPNGSTLQLFVMDDDGKNVEQIGHLNLGEALHPVVLQDGRIMFSTLENQGMRGNLNWGMWSIHPDGTNWGPIISAFYGDSFHFQTQLSDGSIVAQLYYNVSNLGAGTYYKLPPRAPEGTPGFYPADTSRTPEMRFLSWISSPLTRMSFQPYGMESLTRFVSDFDVPGEPDRPGQDRERYAGPRMGKVTHPGAAPDNHLLTVWSGGRVKWDDTAFDSGIYLIKGGKPVNAPGDMLLIKNDPKYNEQWPKALVPYQRIHGIPEPKMLPTLRNDGKRSSYLPEGTPFGLVGTSSIYKRESATRGAVRGNGVTAVTEDRWLLDGRNWTQAGADAGRYENSDIWGIRIVALEPTTDLQGSDPGRHYFNHAKSEKMRILGEIPVRKFSRDPKGSEPLDPDGNPDTSFLAKIPADMAWTFQTIDKYGMVLNMAQTWHQIRPGEIRHDCGGCHAHSQKPTEFKLTAAAKSDYVPFDLTQRAPLLTGKKLDQSGKQWDAGSETGLRYAKGGVVSIEFYRDIKPILDRSCAACHTKSWPKPAGNLVLDDDRPMKGSRLGRVAGTYVRLAQQNVEGVGSTPTPFGHKPPRGEGHWGTPTRASRYIWKLQARRSLLTWKIFGKRLDGFRDEDFTTETRPGDNTSLQYKGRAVDAKTWKFKDNPKEFAPHFSINYHGSIMPPPKAVAGNYTGPDGKKIKVAPLTDEDRLTIVRWIDLGCPIDLDYDPAKPQARGYGFACDDQRPTLTLTYPQPNANPPLSRILVGMHDYYTGLDPASFTVTADFPLDGVKPGQNLASKFKALPDNRWEWKLTKPLAHLPKGKLTVSVKDKQGNITKIERTFSVR